MNPEKHLISQSSTLKEALSKLDALAEDAILFVIDDDAKLVGSLTDGDVRRGLLKNLSAGSLVANFFQKKPHYLEEGKITISDVIALREELFGIVPILNTAHEVVDLINFRLQTSYLHVDAVVMAGGMGSRLKPLTNKTPKPLLKVGEKAIIDHNIDRLIKYGIRNYWVSVRYLGQQIVDHFDKKDNNANFQFVWEDEPLGTVGAVSKITGFKNDYVLITNSDLLTNMDYEDFFIDFIDKEADMAVVTIPYHVTVPYAVLEFENERVTSFKEKPKYTYYSNAGIYLVKREVLELIPNGQFYNCTDLMEEVIKRGMKLVSYANKNYWLDIGKPQDFEKAQKDIIHLQL